ncbi:MAG: PhzF family phenazine biosynthesis protein, partial [Nocardioidaceae bacterium]
MRLPFDIVDVFAERPFAGNQLAVVRNGGALTGDQCLTIAREFGFSETTFPAPVNGEEYSTRIFTPGGEIPFAGHPTLGTAWVLRSHGLLVGEAVTQVCAAGRIGVTFGEMVSLSATPHDLVGPLADDLVEALLADLGLAIDDLAGEVWLAGTGLTFVHVPVAESAIASARQSACPLASYGERLSGGCLDPVDGINLYATTGS